MTAFLIIPATPDSGTTRRVDLADFGSLFAEVEEPHAIRRPVVSLRRLVSTLAILLLMLGDTVLMARPQSVAACLFRARQALTAPV